MYEFLDRPVSSLDRGGRFLIWSMRSWVQTLAKNQCQPSAIAPAFARWQMLGGLRPFHRTMLILNRDALENIQFCSLMCNHVAEDEAIILGLVANLCARRTAQVRDTLALIVAEDSIGDLLGALSELASAMAIAGLAPGSPAALFNTPRGDGARPGPDRGLAGA